MEDHQLKQLLERESRSYLNCIDLIAASNAPTRDVRQTWSAAQFRAAEGYPGGRPYAGTANFDEIEQLAVRRACSLFAAQHANVQPLSGSLANLAAYKAVLRRGDKILAMSKASGGHLSHSGKGHIVRDLYRVVNYDVDRHTALVDYDQIRDQALRERPQAIIAGFSCYPRMVDFSRFAAIAAEAGAVLIADISHIAGLVAAGLHPNPCDWEAIVTSSAGKTLRGTRGGLILGPARLAGEIDAAVFPGLQSSIGLGGLVSVANVLFEAASPQFAGYQARIIKNAGLVAEALLGAGVPLLTGGTDTHLLVIDCRPLGINGKQAEQRLESIGILSNRTALPFDPAGQDPNGLRLGTAAVTARGFEPAEICEIAQIVAQALAGSDKHLKSRVHQLASVRRASDTLADLVETADGPYYPDASPYLRAPWALLR